MTRLPAGMVESKPASTPSRSSHRILRIEDHDEALPLRRDSAEANRVLVHVDAHRDMWWVPPGQRVRIANFMSPALQEEIHRETYWAVRDRPWEPAENRRRILHHLRRIQENFSTAFLQGEWVKVFGEIGQSFKQAAVWAGRIGKNILRGARKPFMPGYEFWQAR